MGKEHGLRGGVSGWGGTQNLNLLHVHEPYYDHLQNGNHSCYLWVALKMKGNQQEKYLGFSFSSSLGFYSSLSAFWSLHYKMDMKTTYPAMFNEVKQKPL